MYFYRERLRTLNDMVGHGVSSVLLVLRVHKNWEQIRPNKIK